MNLFSIIISVLPIFLIAIYVYSKDNEKEPKRLLKKLILGGIFSCVLVLFVSNIISAFSSISYKNITELSEIQLIIYSFVNVGLVEEACKIFYLYKYTYNSKEFDYAFDMIVYAIFISLGFAVFENIFYVSQYGVFVGLIRAFTAVPMHACFGVLMGIFLSNAKQCQLINKNGVFLNTLLSLFIPAFLHGLYDYLAIKNILFAVILALITIFLVVVIFNYKKAHDKKIQLKNKFCIHCGASVSKKYCEKCGKENI